MRTFFRKKEPVQETMILVPEVEPETFLATTFLCAGDTIIDTGFTTWRQTPGGEWYATETSQLKGLGGTRVVFESPKGCLEYAPRDLRMGSGDTLTITHIHDPNSKDTLTPCTNKPKPPTFEL